MILTFNLHLRSNALQKKIVCAVFMFDKNHKSPLYLSPLGFIVYWLYFTDQWISHFFFECSVAFRFLIIRKESCNNSSMSERKEFSVMDSYELASKIKLFSSFFLGGGASCVVFFVFHFIVFISLFWYRIIYWVSGIPLYVHRHWATYSFLFKLFRPFDV